MTHASPASALGFAAAPLHVTTVSRGCLVQPVRLHHDYFVSAPPEPSIVTFPETKRAVRRIAKRIARKLRRAVMGGGAWRVMVNWSGLWQSTEMMLPASGRRTKYSVGSERQQLAHSKVRTLLACVVSPAAAGRRPRAGSTGQRAPRPAWSAAGEPAHRAAPQSRHLAPARWTAG